MLLKDPAVHRLFDAVISSDGMPPSIREDLNAWDAEVERLTDISELTPALRVRAIELTNRIREVCASAPRVVRASSIPPI